MIDGFNELVVMWNVNSKCVPLLIEYTKHLFKNYKGMNIMLMIDKIKI